MDPFTERMLERARARREKLDSQLNHIGQLVPRTRHILQSTQSEVSMQNKVSRNATEIIAEKHENKTEYKSLEMNYTEEYSDKNKENELMENREADVRSCVRSRLKKLGAMYSDNLDFDDPGEMPSPSHRSELKGFEVEETCPARKPPAHTMQRLAALADNINHWEDDLSHAKLANSKELVTSKNSSSLANDSSQVVAKKVSTNSATSAHIKNVEKPQEVKKPASVVSFSPKNSPQKPPRTPTRPVVWDQAIIATLEQEEGGKKGPERQPPNSNDGGAKAKEPTTPTRTFSPRSGPADAENGHGAKQLTPRKQAPAVGSILHRAALFESPTKSPKAKDPAELSVAERKALFEKNKGQALIPKVAFSMSVPAKQLASSPQNVKASPSKKPSGFGAPNLGTNIQASKTVAPKPTTKEVSREDDKAPPATSRVLDARNLFERGQRQQKLENDILKNVQSERQRELNMLLNRWNKQKEVDSDSDVPEEQLKDTLVPQKNFQSSQAPIPPPPPPPLPPPSATYVKSPSYSLHKNSPLSPHHKSKTSPHSDKLASLVNVRKIKVSPAKPGCLYPCLSDIEATESEMDHEESEGENESFGDLESSGDISDSDASVGAGDTSFGREIFQAAGIQNNLGKKRANDMLTKTEEAVFDEMDELLEEALAEEYMMGGPTPPKRKSGDSPMSPPKTSAGNGHRSDTYATSVKNYYYDHQEEHLPTHVVEGDQHLPLMHTVSFYRKQQAQSSKTNTMRQVLHSEPDFSKNSHSGANNVSADKKNEQAVQKKIKSLLDEVSIQQTIISQASQALNLCSSTIEFSESAEQVEGERLLLVATHRRQAALHEIQRLKVEGTLWPKQSPDGPDAVSLGLEKGDLSITEITLPLKREFLSGVANGDVDFTHHFVCLVKHQETVISTEMLSTANINKSRGVIMPSLRFLNTICLSGLYSDFKVSLEVYGLQVRKEVLSHEAKYHIRKDASKIRLTPKKLLKQESRLIMPVVQSPAGPSAVRSTAFSLAGYVIFSLRELNRVQWTLNKVPYSSPLEGIVHMKLQCHLDQAVEERGFLTMFDDVSGFGAWHRRWCLLQADKLAYWKYPEDERRKEPIGWVNLNACTTHKVGPVPREICARPNTFLLETRRPPLPEDTDTLVLVTSSTHTTIRHLLSADSKEERQLWCSQINKALMTLRAWGPKS